MCKLRISVFLCTLVQLLLTFLVAISYGVKLECIQLKQCPMAVQLLKTRKNTPETIAFLNSISCGYDENLEQKVWCAKLSFCKTPDNINGTCTALKKCPPLLQLLKLSNSYDLIMQAYLKKFRCNTNLDEQVHVCCPDIDTEMQNVYPINEMPNRFQQDNLEIPGFPHWPRNDQEAFHNGHRPYPEFDFPAKRNTDQIWDRHAGDDFNFKLPSFNPKHSHHFHPDWNTFPGKPTRKNWFDSGPKHMVPKWDMHSERSTKKYNEDHTITENYQTSTEHYRTRSTENYHISTEKYPKSNEDEYEIDVTCKTADKKDGVCKSPQDCKPYLKLLKNSARGIDRDHLASSQCPSNNKELKVCCPKEETGSGKKDKGNGIFSSRGVYVDPNANICGRQPLAGNKILGGTMTDLGEFPWTALLQYESKSGFKYGCGGSLINSRYVLTAAHCVDDYILQQKGLGKIKRVVLGEYDIRNKTDCVYFKYGEDCAEPPQYFGIESIISHTDYNFTTTKNDIAIIKLDRKVTFTDYIRPICLPTNNTRYLKGNETLKIAGWGKTETAKMSPVKLQAKLAYKPKENCNSLSYQPLSEGQFCAGDGNGTDSCNGDSGGPVMVDVKYNGEFVMHLVGIISYGFGSCGTGPSVSTYVPYYIDWIHKKMDADNL